MNLASPHISPDDKTPICIPFILNHLQNHRPPPPTPNRPLIIGLNGVQGVGKTTLVGALAAALSEGEHNARTLVFSLDDFYLTRKDQLALGARHPGNALVQHRGEPGTHDVELLQSVLAALVAARPTKIPRYDKALFAGQGDRLPEEYWTPVNQPGQEPVQVVILEGWAVGFRPLAHEEVAARWRAPSRSLCRHRLEHLLFVNDSLRNYDAVTNLLDAFVHLDAEDAEFVYAWRQEQEDSLRVARGDPSAGMTPEQVARFVDGYFPAYELYIDGMRRGVFRDRPGCQLRIVVGGDRKVKQVIQI